MTASPATIQPEELLAAGYRRFEDGTRRTVLGPSYLGTYQKRFDDSVGKKYFINIDHVQVARGESSWESMSASAQFSRKGSVVNIELMGGDEALAEIEALFEEFWGKMRFEHHETL